MEGTNREHWGGGGGRTVFNKVKKKKEKVGWYIGFEGNGGV